jgi:hypothetical protein
MPDVESTSIAREAGWADISPTTAAVARAAGVFAPSLARLLAASLTGASPVADAAA